MTYGERIGGYPPASKLLHWLVAVCVLIYLNLVLPLMLRSRWIDAIAIALTYGTGIVFVVVFTRIAASERKARAEFGLVMLSLSWRRN